jgi:hypothetical protein
MDRGGGFHPPSLFHSFIHPLILNSEMEPLISQIVQILDGLWMAAISFNGWQ